MEGIHRRSVSPPPAPPAPSSPPGTPPPAAPASEPSRPVERGRATLAGRPALQQLASPPRPSLLPASRPRLALDRLPRLSLGASVDTPVDRDQIAPRLSGKERSFALVELLTQLKFPGARAMRNPEYLPVNTQPNNKLNTEGSGERGRYDPERQLLEMSEADLAKIEALREGSAQAYTDAAGAVATFHHEMIHRRHPELASQPWFPRLAEHYAHLLGERARAGEYTPRGVVSQTVSRDYAFEAVAGYAAARAETWMLHRSMCQTAVETHQNPVELRAALLNLKAGYEKGVQQAGKTFGYFPSERSFGGPWKADFPLPPGAIRAQIDAFTGIPSSFDQAFPEYARLLASLPASTPRSQP